MRALSEALDDFVISSYFRIKTAQNPGRFSSKIVTLRCLSGVNFGV
jgi:hypothetical protein